MDGRVRRKAKDTHERLLSRSMRLRQPASAKAFELKALRETVRTTRVCERGYAHPILGSASARLLAQQTFLERTPAVAARS